MKTSTVVPAQANWYIVDADGATLGRLATKIAHVLNGKHKPEWSAHQVHSDHVVVVNAEKVALEGNKEEQKEYVRHSGYLGHIKRTPLSRMRERKPEQILTRAVKGMLPRNKLREKRLSFLHVFVGGEHAHEAQQPQELDTLFPELKNA